MPCLHLVDPNAKKIVETDTSEIGYGGILKQVKTGKEQIIQFTSKHWSQAKKVTLPLKMKF